MFNPANGKLDNIFLKIVFIFEAVFTVLIAIGLLPRELSAFLTLAIIIYIIGASLENSLILAILSIPFYMTLPISASLDSMSNWRIILLVLFFKFAVEKIQNSIFYRHPELVEGSHPLKDVRAIPRDSSTSLRGVYPEFIEGLRMTKNKLNKFLVKKDNRLIFWSAIFAVIALFSLVGSENIGAGIKKILFLANIFVIFLIVKNLSRNKETFLRILKTSVAAGIFSLAIGYLQLASIFFISLERFWQFWTDNAINALYGEKLAYLLSYSNTWFSYYQNDIPPTLRMFSVFPDSHSFALFNVILIPFILVLILYHKNNAKLLIANCLLLIASLLAIIFSGSRGAWVSGAAPLVIALCIFGFGRIKKAAGKLRGLKTWLSNLRSQSHTAKIKNLVNNLFGDKLKIIALVTILFFLLFPVSSFVLVQTQKAEWKRLNTEGDFDSFALFKRLRSIADLDEISNRGRIEIWKETFVSIEKHPVLGVGVGNFTTVLGKNISAAKKGASAHNLFLDVMAEMGVLGLIAFLAIFYEILKTAKNAFLNSKDEIYKFFALASGIYLFWILGYALFDVVLFNDKVLMMFMISTGLLYGINSQITKTE